MRRDWWTAAIWCRRTLTCMTMMKGARIYTKPVIVWKVWFFTSSVSKLLTQILNIVSLKYDAVIVIMVWYTVHAHLDSRVHWFDFPWPKVTCLVHNSIIHMLIRTKWLLLNCLHYIYYVWIDTGINWNLTFYRNLCTFFKLLFDLNVTNNPKSELDGLGFTCKLDFKGLCYFHFKIFYIFLFDKCLTFRKILEFCFHTKCAVVALHRI